MIMKEKLEKKKMNYKKTPDNSTKDSFLKDLKKACQPVKKQVDKQKSSSNKT